MESYQFMFPSPPEPTTPTANMDSPYFPFSPLGMSGSEGHHEVGSLSNQDSIGAKGGDDGQVVETTKGLRLGESRGESRIAKKVRKHRYAFQTRSQVDILDDGYRWRKYGQKAVKNNDYPRSYYRCTHQGCSVKKQVQRLSKDEGVVITTYEGIHSHPIEKSTDNFEHILSQMQIFTAF